MSWLSTSHYWLLAVNLTAWGCSCLAAVPETEETNRPEQEERFLLHAGIASAREHAKAIRLLTGYEADPGECGDQPLGPLPQGQYTGRQAWLKLVETACRLRDGSSGGPELFADMSDCKCNFGLPRFVRFPDDQMFVTTSPPQLGKTGPLPVMVISRRRIDDIAAASVPDLLRYISQTAFHRGSGYRASGVQYAELRGLGASYTLVLLNGRRTFGTVADLSNSAFDISMIPINAVDRVEISMDANSLIHGMDAVGGIVNIILRDKVDPILYVRYGSANGGGTQRQAAIGGGASGERGRVSVLLDVQRWGELLGRERNRWNDQDYRRFGGLDYRTTVASPPNVRSLDGANLPGLDQSFAAARMNADTGAFDFVGGQINTTSLRRYQAIVPESSRATFLANGSLRLGESTVSMELLSSQRKNELQLMPAAVSGVWGANHPENPFGVAVRVDALLAGLPSLGYRYETTSTRAVAAIDGPLGNWKYSAFMTRSDERVDVSLRNVANPRAIANALRSDDSNEWLSIYSTVRRTAIPIDAFVDMPATRFSADATHLHFSTQGSFGHLPAGKANLTLGVERRREGMDFDPRLDDVGRDITSHFARLSVPAIGTAMNVPAVRDLTLLLGVRRDAYSDLGAVTKRQFGLVWSVADSFKLHAASSASFRAPSLVDMNQPHIRMPTQIYDPKREEVTPVEIVLGGNRNLRPSTGHSSSIAASFQFDDGSRVSVEYWRAKVRDQIAAVAASSLLAHEDSVPEGRVVRDEQTGRLLSLDIRRANAGGATTEGVDLAVEKEIETRWGWFMPSLQVTLTDEFHYSDQLQLGSRLENRLGVASELGSVPRQRAVAALAWEGNEWRVSVHARLTSSYRDRSEVTGQPMEQRVPSGALWDLNVSRRIAGNLRLMVGASNVLDREPPFARAGGPLGFDSSQGDLVGREIFGSIVGTF